MAHPLLGSRTMETHFFPGEPITSSESLYTNSGKLNFQIDSVGGRYGNVQYIGSSFGPLLNLGAYPFINLNVDKVVGQFDLSLLLQSVDSFGDPYSAFYSGVHITSGSDGHTVGFDLTSPDHPAPHFDRSRLYIAVLTISSTPGHGTGSADFTSFSASSTPVPEPATMAGLACGLLMLRRRKRKG